MIRVTIELIPFGDEKQKDKLGIIEIINNGTGNDNFGNYDVTVSDIENETIFNAYIFKFPRKSGFWNLIKKAIKTIKE